ncbi:MAG TPA: MFS transporter [Solirubrobacteraceae bacterium]|nr:MFS transporter [Solirubrobacteraceae bacterium]
MSARRAITVVFFVDGALFATWVSRIPALATNVGANSATLGLALLAPAIGAPVAMPAVGRWLPGRSSRSFCRAATAGLAVAVMLPALAGSVALLGLALLLVGLANATLDVSMNAHGVAVERRLERPVLSSLHAAFSFGGCAGAGLGGLAALAGIDATAHLAGAGLLFGVVGLVASRWLLPVDGTSEGGTERLRIMRLPTRLALLGAACFCSFLAEGGAADWSAKLVRDDLAGSAALGAIAYATFSLAMGSGRLLSDAIWSRWGPVRLLRRFSLLASTGFAAALLIGSAPAALAGFAALGLGLSAGAPTLFRSAAGQPGVATAPALAIVSMLGYTGFLAGPPIVGGLAQLTSLRVACGLFVLAGLLVLSLAFAARPLTHDPRDVHAAAAR